MPHDLTDTWQGRFSFPRLYEPVSFEARLQQTGEWLSGTVSESVIRGAAAGRVVSATISGKVTSDTVIFLKTYDAQSGGYDAVQYAGTVGDQGLEISGTWTIPGNWSGAFIMIRSRGLALAQSRQATERV